MPTINISRNHNPLSCRKGCAILLLLCFLASPSAIGQPSSATEGRDFWVTMLLNYSYSFNSELGAVTSNGGQPALFVSGPPGTTVQVTNPLSEWSTTATIGADGWSSLQLPQPGVHFLARPVAEAFHVTADSTVSVTAVFGKINTTDASSILTTRSLGTHYIVQDYATDGAYFGCEVALLAVEDSTLVTFRVNAEVMGGLLHAGDTVRQWLMQGEVYRLMTWEARSFSGMEITSNGKPFALFQGHDCNYVPGDGTTAMDHLYEQALPVPMWGKEFVLVPTCGRSGGSVGGDRVKVTAADSCTVSLNGVPIDTLGPLQSFEFGLPAGPAWRLAATAPVCVMQYLTSNQYGGEPGDPSSLTVVPVDKGVSHAAFTTFNTQWTVFTAHYVNIVAPTSTLGGLTLDSIPVSHLFTPVDSLYSYACIEIDLGRHTLESTGGSFVAHVYGLEHDETYAYSLGIQRYIPLMQNSWHDTVCQGADYAPLFPGLPSSLTQDTGTFLYTYHESTEDTVWDYSLTLTVLPAYRSEVHYELVPGETVTIEDTVLATPGTYTFRHTTENGCDSVLTVVLDYCTAPTPCVNISRPIIDFDFPVVTMEDCSEGHTLSTWQFSDGVTLSGNSVRRQLHHPLPDSLEVHLTSCNDAGCCSDTVFVLPTKIRSVWFPNTFTPGGEENNLFGAIASVEMEMFELHIFDRRGQQVFHSTDATARWDGIYAGRPLPQGAYTYRWQARDIYGFKHSGLGTVTLLR